MPLSSGTRLGAYEVIAPIGAGGMGEVYRARDLRLDRLVAIKLLPGVSGDATGARLEHEARAAAALNHPNICTIHEIDEDDHRLFIVMELIDGRPLSELVHAMPVASAIRYGIQITDALAHAHARGVVHRDLKSANLMVTTDDRIKVLDFGIARRTEAPDAEAPTRIDTISSGTIAGTPAYMAPEALRGGPADRRSDIWALGIVLYEMVAGRRPFGGATSFEVTSAILRDEPPRLPSRVPSAFRAVIDRCLAKEPGARYQYAGEVRAALETALATASVGSRTSRRDRKGGVPERRARPGRIRSLAVLPLENLSNDPEQEYFADGMTEALIAELAQIGSLRVISRSSAMRYKGTHQPVDQIARALSLDAVIEGSVRRVGDQIRVTLELIHVGSDRHLWARSYDRDVTNVLQLQREIAGAVAGEIQAALTPGERARLGATRFVDPAAYDAYLRGRHHVRKLDDDSMRAAIGQFARAVDIQPDFAPAHAGLAEAHHWRLQFGTVEAQEAAAAARAAARRALTLDAALSDAHLSLAMIAMFHDWDWNAASTHFQRAIELKPGSAEARMWYGWYLSCVEHRHSAALPALEQAGRLDPHHAPTRCYHGFVHLFAGDAERALELFQAAVAMEPRFWLGHFGVAAVQSVRGRAAEAVAGCEIALACNPGAAVAIGGLGRACAIAGQSARAKELLADLLSRAEQGVSCGVSIATIFAGLGDLDEALRWLDRARQQREGDLIYVTCAPQYEPLRADPRYADLVSRMGLASFAATAPASPANTRGRSGTPAARLRPPGRTVGRHAERAALRSAFEQAAKGPGLLVGIAGEPGLGKTTLVDDLLADLDVEGHACTIARGRCSERLAGTEAYLPVLEALDSLTRAGADAHFAAMLRAVAPTWYAQLAPLKPEDPSDGRLLADVKAASQERLKREFVAFLSEAGRLRPLLLFLDDVHWADASTVDLVAYLADRFDQVRCLVVTTYRPTELALAKHPFATLKLGLAARGVARELALDFLTREDVEHYLALEFPGHRFPPAFQEVIHAKTEGNPLFVVDLLRYLRDGQVIGQEQGHWVLTQPVIAIEREVPASVRSMIQRKLDQVAEEDRRLLLAASVQGHDFDSAVVARALGLDAADVEERLDALARIHALVHRAGEHALPDGTLNVRYRFVHVLYQNALYDSLAPTRRASLSRAIAEALAGYYGERRAEIASTLALLFEAARDAPRAVEYFQTAATHSMQVFAYHETVGVASRGLLLLESLPETPERLRKELALQLLLGAALTATHGWGAPEVQRTYARAQELSETAGEPPELFPALFGLASFYTVRAEYPTVQKIAERLVRIAEKAQDSGLLLLAHWTTAWTWWMQGEFGRSRSHYARCDSLYVPTQHHALSLLYGVDPGVGSLITGALVQWHLGYADQSLAAATRSLTHASEHAHPFTVVYALGYALMLHQLRREPQAVRERLESFMTLVTEHQFTTYYLPWGTFFAGWALAEEGEVQKGISQMQQALEGHRSGGGELYRPAFLALLAEACGKAGRPDDGLAAVAEALSLVMARGERQHEAEIHRIKGDLLLRRDPPDQAEAERCFHQALAVARRQQAKSLELRAAVSLGRLWQARGRRDEARALVGGVYAWFTEGFDTVDLREAKSFLAE